jgi:LPPG:FO 2-phospho-L-lactate transferase
MFWLTDRIDERGWGLRDDTFAVMDGLRELGVDVWFALGDRDLAIGIERARRLREGSTLTDTLADLGAALGVRARVVPMSNEPVRTWVQARGRWMPFQEFMIRARANGPIDDVELRGASESLPAPEALAAIAAADAIVLGPSNPVISIGPILAVPDMREALIDSRAPIVAVSPFVEGAVVKGPTDAFMRWAGHPRGSDGIADCYGGLIDGLVADEAADGLPVLRTDMLMRDADDRRRLATQTLHFAEGLA